MDDLPYVYDAIGVLPEDNGRRVRIVITVEDGPPATLWMMSYGADGLDREYCPLVSWTTPAWQGFAIEHFKTVDTHITFNPSDCGCGAGRLPLEDIIPGRGSVRVRTPAWMEDVT